MCFESVFAANRYINMTLIYDYTNHKYSAEEVFVAIDGNKLTNLLMPPIILNNYTLVPAREIFESVGAKVDWIKDVEQVCVTYNSKVVVIPINSNKAYIDGVASTMQTNAKIINNKTMIPLRFVSTALGFEVQWDKTTRVANIITEKLITTEITTQTTTQKPETTTTTTVATTTTEAAISEPATVDNITLSKSSSRDLLTIEGSGAVTVNGTMSADKSAFNLTIENAKLSSESGNLGEGTYVKNGYYYQNGNGIGINLLVKESVGIKSVTNYGSKTVVTIDFQSETAPASTGYDSENEKFVISNASSIDINKIIHNDDYNNLKYTLTLPGNYSGMLSTSTYDVNSNYMKSVNVNVSNSETTITFNENRILAYNIESIGGNITITPVLPKEKYKKIIVLDAGHGGDDPGASGQGLIEKDLTLNMLLKTKALFDNDGTIKCYATRTTDMYPSFDDRTNLANEVGDAFISIHINAAESASASGTETWSLYPNDLGNGLTSYELAETILNNLVNNLGTTNRKVKSESWIVLRQSTIPSTLIEIGFISNANDAAIMGTESGQQSVARAIFDSVKTLFDKYTPVR